MKAVNPVVDSAYGKNKVKMSLIDSVAKALGLDEYYYRMTDKSRKVIEIMTFMSREKGFVYIKQDTVAEKAGVTARTVRNIMRKLIEAGEVAVAYRRNQRTNAKGTPVYFFTKHPYFKKWAKMLGLEVADVKPVEPPVMPDFQDEYLDHFQEEKEDKPTESKAEESNSVSYHKRPYKTDKLRDFSYISNSVLTFAQEKGKEMMQKAVKIKEYWKERLQLCAEALPKKMDDLHYKALEIVIKEMMPDVTADYDARAYFAKCFNKALERAKLKVNLYDWTKDSSVSSQEAHIEALEVSTPITFPNWLKTHTEALMASNNNTARSKGSSMSIGELQSLKVDLDDMGVY